MRRDPLEALDDIVDAAGWIAEYVEGLDLEMFRADRKTADAVIRNLEVIGEAAKRVPADVREQMSEVEWSRVAGLRDVLIHGYFMVDLDIVWDVASTKVPTLRLHVQKWLSEA